MTDDTSSGHLLEPWGIYGICQAVVAAQGSDSGLGFWSGNDSRCVKILTLGKMLWLSDAQNLPKDRLEVSCWALWPVGLNWSGPVWSKPDGDLGAKTRPQQRTGSSPVG